MSKALLNTLHTAYRVDFEAAKGLVERAAGEARDLSAEEEGQYARLNESMNAKLAKIEDIQKSEDRAVKIAALAETVEVATGKTIDNDADLLRAVLAGEKRSARFDLRALATATATTPVSFADFVVEALVEGNVVYEGASKIRTTDIRNLTIPVVAGTAPAAAFVGQGGTITAADPVFSSITLGAFNAATLTLASRELVDSAGFNLVVRSERVRWSQPVSSPHSTPRQRRPPPSRVERPRSPQRSSRQRTWPRLSTHSRLPIGTRTRHGTSQPAHSRRSASCKTPPASSFFSRLS